MTASFAQRMVRHTTDEIWFKVSFSSLAGLVLLSFAIFSRFSHLTVIPLQPRELPAVVSAMDLSFVGHSVEASVSGSSVSPLLHASHQMLLSLFGPEIGWFRFPNAVLGLCLIFSPFLFSKWMRVEHCGTMSILLLLSPLVLLSSRYAESALWALIGCALTFLSLQRCLLAEARSRQRRSWQHCFTVFSFLTLFLTDGRSYLLFVSISVALFFTLRKNAPIKRRFLELLQEWRWRKSLAVGLATVILLSTQLLTQWSGLNHVGNQLLASLSGWIQPGDLLQDLRVSLFYELGFWLLAVVALITLRRERKLTPLNRFSLAWLVALLVLLTLDRGSQPAHASWLSVPLILIVADCLIRLGQGAVQTLNQRGFSGNVAFCGMLYALSLGLLLWVGLQFRFLIVRTDFMQSALGLLHGTPSIPSGAAIWWLMRIAIGFLLYFVVLLALQYVAKHSSIGSFFLPTLAIFLLLYTTHSSIRVASADQASARSAWLPQLNTVQNAHLHETLQDLLQQSNWAQPSSVAWVTAAGVRDDQYHTMLWLLRDFDEVRMLPKLELAAGFPLVISDPIAPEEAGERLAAPYIGHPFSITRVKQARPLGAHFLTQLNDHHNQGMNDPHFFEYIPMVLWLHRDVLNQSVNHP